MAKLTLIHAAGGLGSIATLALCAGMAAGAPGTGEKNARGHPSFSSAPFAGASMPLRVDRGASPASPLPTVSPLESGPFVNFESPAVKALAVSGDGQRVFLANTPASMLTVIDASGPVMRVLRNIPVGADPVTAAIQPNSGDRILWTANFISDDVSVVDTASGTVKAVIDVGDEPVNILFSPDGAFAYVVLQGPHAQATPPFNQFSSLVTISVPTLSVVHTLELTGHTARAAALDPVNRRLIIAALHSGNNTTVVGNPIVRFFPPPSVGAPAPSDSLPSVQIVKQFSATAEIFANSPSLAPYPDVSVQPNAPLVQRIVRDAEQPSEWAQVIDVLADANGQPEPAMVALYAAQFGVTNAQDILAGVINDAKDTLDHDLILVDVSTPDAPVQTGVVGGVGTTLTGLAFDPETQRAVVMNIGARNTIRHEPNLEGRFVTHELVVVSEFSTPTIERFDLHAGFPQALDLNQANPQLFNASLANPADVVLRPDGASAFVAASGPGRVGVVDTSTGRVIARVPVGRGVRSLALDQAGRRLFAYNRTDSSVTRIDVSNPGSPVLLGTARVFNPEPKAIRTGRDFAYSTRFSLNNQSSCTSCHIDINMDHLAWDLGNPSGAMLPTPTNVGGENHPLKGPMVTQSLRGLKGHNAFHWRGDKPEFVDFNGAFDSLLGGQLLAASDMGKFDTFIKTVAYPPNPFWTRENAPKDAAVIPGLTVFASNCNGCHAIDHDGSRRFPGSPDDVGLDLGFMFSQIMEIAQLRALYKKFPSDRYTGVGLLHDGREESETNGHPLQTFLRQFFRNLNAQQRSDLIAMVTAFPTNATNVVGWELHWQGVPTPGDLEALDRMILQNKAVPSRCDVIAQGMLAGVRRGYLYEPSLSASAGTPTFRSDRDELVTIAELGSLGFQGGLVIMATPPGSGRRMAIDADQDCKLNGLDPLPYSSPDINEDGVVSVQDLFDFLAFWFAGAFEGDFNWTGDVSVQDIFDFLQAWFAGGCA